MLTVLIHFAQIAMRGVCVDQTSEEILAWLQVNAIPVVEFSKEGYKINLILLIRKVSKSAKI